MRPLAAGILFAGVAFVGVIAATRGSLSVGQVTVLAAIVLLAGIGLSALTRLKAVAPATCERCGGLISPNAPYCKHCGAESG